MSLSGSWDALGHAWIHLDSIHECQPLDEWLELEGPGGKAGRVHIVAEMRSGRPGDFDPPTFNNRASDAVLEVRGRRRREVRG